MLLGKSGALSPAIKFYRLDNLVTNVLPWEIIIYITPQVVLETCNLSYHFVWGLGSTIL